MAARRTFITVNWSLQRIEHGEQPPWMAVTLAAMLGQIGLPGGGFGLGYGSLGYIGRPHLRIGPPALAQGPNPVHDFIPVARISDMLLHPGEPFEFDGQHLTYPDIKLVYWCGGNPFHHHQDLARLRRAFGRPDTIVVHEPHWTPMARHADIVLPATLTLERNDIGGSTHDPALVAMKRAVDPFAGSRNDFDIFSDLAARLGAGERFTAGRTEMEWLRHLYESWWEKTVGVGGWVPPQFDEFWEAGSVEIPESHAQADGVLYEEFRANPERAPLRTPSGRIEIFSETIARFGYDDCPGHPTWIEPTEWLGAPIAARVPLHLVANNPKTRLHSQLDMGAYSQASKVQGREPIRIHPSDAAARGISDGDVVRVFNDRGSCLAGAVVTDAVRQGAVQLSTGAWYDPLDPADPTSMCVHGNPNVLTFDRGTSRLAQGCAGQHALVDVARWTGPLPPIRAFDPPKMAGP
jgi:biotin/methionine sulfoxide reductase